MRFPLLLQSQWAGTVPQTVPIALSTTPAADVPAAKPAAPAVPLIPQAVAPVKCNWTEHTSPDGYKYYHNSATGESRVRILSDLHCFWDLSPIHAINVYLNEHVVGET